MSLPQIKTEEQPAARLKQLETHLVLLPFGETIGNTERLEKEGFKLQHPAIMRQWLVFSLVLMLLLWGCTGPASTPSGPTGASGSDTTTTTGNEAENDAENLAGVCFPLMLKNGEYIFTAENATQAMGGVWTVYSGLFIDPEIPGHCAYVLKNPLAAYPQLIVQTTVPSDTFEPEGKKDIPGLGKAYVEGSFLTIRKGRDVIAVSCSKSAAASCNDSEFLRIGEIILSRWP